MKRPLSYALSAALTQGLLSWAAPGHAAIHAVLIGVGEYEWLDADLKGPPNDVRLMAGVLAARGVQPEDMILLTTDPSDLPAGAILIAPTREGIFSALTSVEQRAQPGDTVVFYFSGHGAQAPDLNGDEGGGYDEIFLPMDAHGWQGEIGMVGNAIVDDELHLWAQGLLGREVQLIGIIDACHSATGFRALSADPAAGVARTLAPDTLGIPDDVDPVPFTGENSLSGAFAFLYSSQSDERSFEYPLGDTGIWHGEFTLRLAQVLSSAEDASWQQVLTATSDAMLRGVARQVPEGEGPLMQQRVFGEGAVHTRFRIENQTLQAGLLQGFAEGGEVLLYEAGAGGESIASATLGKVAAREAQITGALPEGALWAAPGRPPAPEALTLGPVLRADPGDGLDYSPWEAALAAYEAAAGKPAALIPVLTGGDLALAGPDGVLDPDGPGSSPRVMPWEGESGAEALERVLSTMAHGARLRDVLASAAGRGLTRKEVISVDIERRAGEEIRDPTSGAACSGKAGAGLPHDPALGVSGCDQLWLTLTNSSGRAQDVTVLYLTSGMEVQPIWPAQNIVNRILPGEAARVGLQIDPVLHPGVEEIWILAVPMDERPGALRTDLTALAPGTMRGAGAASDMALWLEEQTGPVSGADDETKMRGFSARPADLTMIRRIVRLTMPADLPLTEPPQ